MSQRRPSVQSKFSDSSIPIHQKSTTATKLSSSSLTAMPTITISPLSPVQTSDPSSSTRRTVQSGWKGHSNCVLVFNSQILATRRDEIIHELTRLKKFINAFPCHSETLRHAACIHEPGNEWDAYLLAVQDTKTEERAREDVMLELSWWSSRTIKTATNALSKQHQYQTARPEAESNIHPLFRLGLQEYFSVRIRDFEKQLSKYDENMQSARKQLFQYEEMSGVQKCLTNPDASNHTKKSNHGSEEATNTIDEQQETPRIETEQEWFDAVFAYDNPEVTQQLEAVELQGWSAQKKRSVTRRDCEIAEQVEREVDRPTIGNPILIGNSLGMTRTTTELVKSPWQIPLLSYRQRISTSSGECSITSSMTLTNAHPRSSWPTYTKSDNSPIPPLSPAWLDQTASGLRSTDLRIAGQKKIQFEFERQKQTRVVKTMSRAQHLFPHLKKLLVPRSKDKKLRKPEMGSSNFQSQEGVAIAQPTSDLIREAWRRARKWTLRQRAVGQEEVKDVRSQPDWFTERKKLRKMRISSLKLGEPLIPVPQLWTMNRGEGRLFQTKRGYQRLSSVATLEYVLRNHVAQTDGQWTKEFDSSTSKTAVTGIQRGGCGDTVSGESENHARDKNEGAEMGAQTEETTGKAQDTENENTPIGTRYNSHILVFIIPREERTPPFFPFDMAVPLEWEDRREKKRLAHLLYGNTGWNLIKRDRYRNVLQWIQDQPDHRAEGRYGLAPSNPDRCNKPQSTIERDLPTEHNNNGNGYRLPLHVPVAGWSIDLVDRSDTVVPSYRSIDGGEQQRQGASPPSSDNVVDD